MVWEMTSVYASPNPLKRWQLWPRLDELRIEGPWLILGDFNCVLDDAERSSNREASISFQSWVTKKGLVDLGYEGAAFTWNHGRSSETRRAARLDRALCDDSWRRLYPAAMVRHLPHAHSDHCPLLVELEEDETRCLGRRQFRFEAAWSLHEGFDALLKEEWRVDADLPLALKELAVKLRAWNRDTFGNIFKRKRRKMS